MTAASRRAPPLSGRGCARASAAWLGVFMLLAIGSQHAQAEERHANTDADLRDRIECARQTRRRTRAPAHARCHRTGAQHLVHRLRRQSQRRNRALPRLAVRHAPANLRYLAQARRPAARRQRLGHLRSRRKQAVTTRSSGSTSSGNCSSAIQFARPDAHDRDARKRRRALSPVPRKCPMATRTALRLSA